MTDSLKADLEKQQRRQKRNLRNARAKGLMQGILSMLKPDDVVLDCGANVGDVTGPLAMTGALVHAFEPDPWAFAELTEKFSKTKNVILHNAAVGTEAGEIQLMRALNFDKNPKGASVKSTVLTGGRMINEQDGETISVTLIDLPGFLTDLIAQHGEIAFLKMDIEGAELDLLEHMSRQNLFADIRLTVAETHEHKFKELRPRFKALRKEITETYPVTKVNLDWI